MRVSFEKTLSIVPAHFCFSASAFYSINGRITGSSAQCCRGPRAGSNPGLEGSGGECRYEVCSSDDEATNFQGWSFHNLRSSEPKTQKDFVLRDLHASNKSNKLLGLSDSMDFMSISDFARTSDLQVELHTIHGLHASSAVNNEPSRGCIELPCLGSPELDKIPRSTAHHNFSYSENGIAWDVRRKETNLYEQKSSHPMIYDTGSFVRGSSSQQHEIGWGGESEESGKSKTMEIPPLLSNDGNIDTRSFHNLKDVLPLMEPFMDQKGNQRTPFSHRASLVYTPAPCRSGPTKKVAEQVLTEDRDASKRNLQGQQAAEYLSRKSQILEPLHLQRDIEELKKKLLERNAFPLKDIGVTEFESKKKLQMKAKIGVLEEETLRKEHISDSKKYQHSPRPWQLNDMLVADAMSKENIEMKAKILELQDELSRKDHVVDSEKYQLSQKQIEVAELQSNLENAQVNIIKKNKDIADMEKELEKLDRKVASLGSQLKILDILRSQKEVLESKTQVQGPMTVYSHHDLDDIKKDIMETEGSWFSEDHKNVSEKLEVARRMYLASIIAARENPGEESIMLVAQLRQKLQGFLLCSDLILPSSDSLVSETFAFPFG